MAERTTKSKLKDLASDVLAVGIFETAQIVMGAINALEYIHRKYLEAKGLKRGIDFIKRKDGLFRWYERIPSQFWAYPTGQK